MSLTNICVLMAMGYLCASGVVNRICKCIENCYIAKYYKGTIPEFKKNKREAIVGHNECLESDQEKGEE